jgi:hypothetical protein
MIDLVGDTSACGDECPAFIAKWAEWWAEKTRDTLAILEVTSLEEYRRFVGPKSRNMINKANRLYEYRRIQRNDHLDGIAAVARSKPVRQGIPMVGWYTQPVKPQRPLRLCPLHADEWYAGFERETGRMVCFANLKVLNELGILNSIIGDPSAGAAVNGLVAHLVDVSGVAWINYLYPQAKTQTLADFKRRLGFRPMDVPSSIPPAAGALR